MIHQCLGLDPLDVTVYRGIPVTTVARMLVDLSDVLTKWQLANVIHEAAFRKCFDLGATRERCSAPTAATTCTSSTQAIELYLSGSAGTRSRWRTRSSLAAVAGFPSRW